MKTASMRIVASPTLVLAAMLAGTVMFGASVCAAEKDPPVKIPDTIAAIWQSVDQETEGITKEEIETGKLGELHQHAFAIRDLVGALPALSASLAADKLAKVESDVKFVATLSQRLDAAGDANNKSAAESNFEKLRDVLKSIRASYANLP